MTLEKDYDKVVHELKTLKANAKAALEAVHDVVELLSSQDKDEKGQR